MEKSISITIPMEADALLRASTMLSGIAEDITGALVDENPKQTKMVVEEVATPTPVPTPEAVEVVEEVEPDAVAVFAPAPTTEVAPTPEPEAVATPAPEAGAEVDINGIPWDVRIHASTKTKTVDGAWKNKRGVDKEVLASVETELKAVMAVPTPEAVVTPAPTPVPSAPETPAAPGNITTFPDLAKAITTNKIEPQVVAGVMQVVGLASFPLLATRPELIPDVAQRLGL